MVVVPATLHIQLLAMPTMPSVAPWTHCKRCGYWFDKSYKRKGKLNEYREICNQEYREALKDLSVRWLSLEKCINRAVLKHIS